MKKNEYAGEQFDINIDMLKFLRFILRINL